MTAVCDHCGLPLPRPWWGALTNPPAATNRPSVASAAASPPRSAATCAEGEGRQTLTRLGLAIFFSMNVVAFSMTLWTADVYQVEAGGHAELIATLEGLFRHLTLLCAAPVLYLLGWPLFENALEGVRRGVFSTDLLLGAGVAAAFAYSAVSVMRGAGPVDFEVGCVVLVMVTLGRWLEATGKLRQRRPRPPLRA